MNAIKEAMREHAIVFLLVFFFFLYHSNFREHGGGDTQALKFVNFSLVDGHGLNVTPSLKTAFAGTNLEYHTPQQDYILDRPVFTALPFYPLYYWYRFYQGPVTIWAANFIGKFCTVIYALFALVFLYGAARNLGASKSFSVFAVLVFGSSTHIWHTVSQGFWSATGFIPFHCAGIFFATLPKRKTADLVAAGVMFGYAIACRQQDALLALPFIGYLAWFHRRSLRDLVALIAPLAALLVLALYLNHIQNGSILGAYGSTGVSRIDGINRTGKAYGIVGLNFIEGIPAILVSPSRGLFVFSPILLFPLFWVWRERRKIFNPKLLRKFEFNFGHAALAGIALQVLLVGSFSMWWGGFSYGPRLLAATLPSFFVLFVLYLPKKVGGIQKLAIAAALSWSVFTQVLGVYKFHFWLWNFQPVQIDAAPSRVWELEDNQISRAWNDPWFKDSWGVYSKDY